VQDGAAVDDEGLAGDEAAVGLQQEAHHAHEVVGGLLPGQRGVGHEPVDSSSATYLMADLPECGCARIKRLMKIKTCTPVKVR